MYLKKKFTMTLTKAPNTILSETESRESQRIPENPKSKRQREKERKSKVASEMKFTFFLPFFVFQSSP